ncbi:hypothetical protein PG994_012380 [Apiospora phragmitis]|uniref:Uncharacterized protein n=1 Tax=Apiospora phragmitis TaxID=2905665 RepID=A0ABR1TVG8_9PEZI
MSTISNHCRLELFCVRLLLATSLAIAPISATPLPPPAGLEDTSPIAQQETAAAAAANKRTTVSGHGLILGDRTISGEGGEVVTASGGLQTADEIISSESITLDGQPFELTGGGLAVLDGQDGSSVDGAKKNPDGSTSVDIPGSDITRVGLQSSNECLLQEFWSRWRAMMNRSRRPDKKKKKKKKKKKLQQEPDVELEKLPLL